MLSEGSFLRELLCLMGVKAASSGILGAVPRARNELQSAIAV